MKATYDLDAPHVDETERMVRAVRGVGRENGKKVSALIPIKLGGANAAACISAAAELGIYILDGDYTGRAIPEIQQTTPFIHEQNLTPVVACDGWGDIATIESAVNWRMVERIGKQLAVAGFSYSAQAGFFANGADTKKALIYGTMSGCYAVGKALREAVEAGLDPADTIAEKVGGWVICKGTVTSNHVEDKDDYYRATHEITGKGMYADTDLKIWLKNEQHMCWKNGEVFVTSPDMIQIIDTKTSQPYTNSVIEVGMEVSVSAMRRAISSALRAACLHSAHVLLTSTWLMFPSKRVLENNPGLQREGHMVFPLYFIKRRLIWTVSVCSSALCATLPAQVSRSMNEHSVS